MKLKKLTSNVLTWLIGQLGRLLHYIDLVAPGKVENGYEDLAPTKNLDAKSYMEALGYALSNPEVKNIAVTGNYGSGKSSILRSFEQKNKKYRYLNISLATFDDKSAVPEETRKQIEISILQQMFYHVKHTKIPDSRFKRIHKLSHTRQVLYSFFALIWAATLCVVFKIKSFENIANISEAPGRWPDIIRLVSLLLFLCGTIAVTYYLMRPLRNTKFNKLNFVKGEIEIGELGKASILNEYLDEILYFFEVNPFTVVIIEDLDRFNDTAIFTRLRELNNLLNRSEQINRRIVFIYAIKDEMFVDQSRTKFFEFIIPIIPVITSTNSVDQLFGKLDALGLRKELTDWTINDIMLYIEDMRILKNILNEYILYRNILDAKLNRDKLFSIIVYKNLHPKDYAQLNMNEGMIYKAFQDKPLYIRSFIDEKNKKIKELEQAIESRKTEKLKSVAELRALYLFHILKEGVSAEGLRILNTNIKLGRLVEDEYFNQIKESNAQQVVGYNWQNINFSKAEKEVDPDRTYNEREEGIDTSSNDHINDMQKDIAELKDTIREAKGHSLSELIRQQGIQILDKELHQYKLLCYLLRYGLIDEMYPDYISHFYEGSMTRQDRDFILSVKNRESLPFTHPLTNTEKIISRLSMVDLGNPEVLNYSLLDHLLTYQRQYSDQLDAMTEHFINFSNTKIEFLDGYFERGKNIDSFMKHVTHAWPEIWDFILQKSNFPDDKKERYFNAIVEFASTDDAAAIDANKNLSPFIETDADFLIKYPGNGVKSFLHTLNIQFVELNLNDKTSSAFDYVVKHDLYVINQDMINLILMQYKPSSLPLQEWEGSVLTQNYSAIKKANVKTLTKRLEKNINEYFENVFLKIDTNTKEPKSIILELLQNENISHVNRTNILEKEDQIFERLNELPSIYWSTAFQASKIAPIWENVMVFYTHEKTFDPALVAFLNSPQNVNELTKQRLASIDTDSEELKKLKGDFVQALVQCNELSDANYNLLIRSLAYHFTSLDIDGLNDAKINILIDEKKITLTSGHLNALKKRHNGSHIHLLETRLTYFLNYTGELSLEASDYSTLLRSVKVKDEDKIALLKKLPLELVSQNQDLQLTLSDVIIASKETADTGLIAILLDELGNERLKLELVAAQIPFINLAALVLYLQKLPDPYSGILTNPQTKLDMAPGNLHFAQALDNRGFISSVKIDEEKQKIKIRSKRQR